MNEEKEATSLKPKRELARSFELVDLKLVGEGEMDRDLELILKLCFFDLRFALKSALSVQKAMNDLWVWLFVPEGVITLVLDFNL